MSESKKITEQHRVKNQSADLMNLCVCICVYCRPQDIDFHVPPEYLVNSSIRDKLSTLTLKKYKDDLLFFLFYTNVGEFMQLAAAAEL